MKKLMLMFLFSSSAFGIAETSGQVTEVPSFGSLPQSPYYGVPQRLVSPEELQQRDGIMTAMGSELTPEQLLESFYFNTTSFVKVLQAEKRVSGRGWTIRAADFPEWKNAIDKASKQRLELAKEARNLKASSDEFWKKVFDSEITAEKDLCEMLQSVFSPDEQDSFLIDHGRELSTSILTSPMFRDKAKLDTKQYDSLVKAQRDHFAFKVQASSGKPIPQVRIRSVGRAFVTPLTPEQFGVWIELTGRKDPSISLEEHLTSRVDATERGYLIEAMPELRKYVKTHGLK
jgi:hypothetical protein